MAMMMRRYFVLNGLFLETKSITWAVRWVHYISPCKYTWESQAWLECSGTVLTPCEPGQVVCYGTKGDDALHEGPSSQHKFPQISTSARHSAEEPPLALPPI